MGPPRRRGGRTSTLCVRQPPARRLQWGHLVVEVEGFRCSRWGPPGPPSFNGATSSSRWKASLDPWRGITPLWLQWGHLVVEVEGSSRGRRDGHRSAASMGPPRRRGGRVAAYRETVTEVATLQWGHLVVEVEGRSTSALLVVASSALQWGHLVVEVEGDGEQGSQLLGVKASMGPPRRRGGRPSSEEYRRCAMTPLQWGHLVVEVEGGRPLSRCKMASSSFNGATSSSRWKARALVPGAACRPPASMGPPRRRGGRAVAAWATGHLQRTASMGPPRRRGGRVKPRMRCAG